MSPPLQPVAQYLRMSTEHQKYSLENQRRVITAFAAKGGMQVVATYEDAGVSGLGIADRDGLKTLLRDVVARSAPFTSVLVLDVSRWGRFQDPDEAAHYEFICRASGVAVQYCEEGFANDGSLAASLIKHIKRGMAAEYSRELSEKVHRSQETAALGGWWRGSRAPYGFRRQMQAPGGVEGLVMEHGQRKALHGYRSKLVRGPDAEVDIVNWIFERYAVAWQSLTQIARQLNEAGVVGPGGREWHPSGLGAMLQNHVYVGTIVINRSRSRLGRSTRCAPSEWRRVTGACPALTPQWLFHAAQARRSLPRRWCVSTMRDCSRNCADCWRGMAG